MIKGHKLYLGKLQLMRRSINQGTSAGVQVSTIPLKIYHSPSILISSHKNARSAPTGLN